MNSNVEEREMTQILKDLATQLMYFSTFFPFVLLSRLLNVFDRTYFLVFDLLTPFSYACLTLI